MQRLNSEKKNRMASSFTTCPVCAAEYTVSGDRAAKLLPCTHSVCKACVENKLFRYFEKTLACPICNEEHVYCEGLESVRENPYIADSLKTDSLKKDHQDVTVCKSHKRDMNLFCREEKCLKPVCALCLKDHDGHKFDELHVIKRKWFDTLKDEIEEAINNLRSDRDLILAQQVEIDRKKDSRKQRLAAIEERAIQMVREEFRKFDEEEDRKICSLLGDTLRKINKDLESVESYKETAVDEPKRCYEGVEKIRNIEKDTKNLLAKCVDEQKKYTNIIFPQNFFHVVQRDIQNLNHTTEERDADAESPPPAKRTRRTNKAAGQETFKDALQQEERLMRE